MVSYGITRPQQVRGAFICIYLTSKTYYCNYNAMGMLHAWNEERPIRFSYSSQSKTHFTFFAQNENLIATSPNAIQLLTIRQHFCTCHGSMAVM